MKRDEDERETSDEEREKQLGDSDDDKDEGEGNLDDVPLAKATPHNLATADYSQLREGEREVCQVFTLRVV